MYQAVSIHSLLSQGETAIDREVCVTGWARTIRDQKQFGFMDLFDGSCFSPIQIVFEADTLPNYQEIARAGNGAAFVVQGRVVRALKGSRPIEIQAQSILVEGTCPSDYPLQPKRHSVEFLRSIPHLRPRTNLFQAVFRLRSEMAFAIHDFFHSHGFAYIHMPILTSNDCEGAGEMFHVTTLNLEKLPLTTEGTVDYSRDFFAKPVSLTVSGQLHAETYAQALGKVYTFGPTFRAEHSNTPRHAAEFWMIEPEMAFSNLQDVMDLSRDMLQSVLRHLLQHCKEELKFFDSFVEKGLLQRLEHVAYSDFVTITYTEAVDALQKSGQSFQFPVSWGADLQSEHERYLTEVLYQKPVFVINYPKEIKSFYMRLNDDGKTVAAVDCLVPGIGEIIGGSQREERYDLLLERIRSLGMKEEEYRWYLDLRKYGTTHHAGFGLGFERLLMYVTGVSNIRDVLSFPRTTGSAEY